MRTERKCLNWHAATPSPIRACSAQGTDHEGSDLDLLVDALPAATRFDLGELQCELEDLLGVTVDLRTP
jgi:predicted nucleotidyltransferase